MVFTEDMKEWRPLHVQFLIYTLKRDVQCLVDNSNKKGNGLGVHKTLLQCCGKLFQVYREISELSKNN